MKFLEFIIGICGLCILWIAIWMDNYVTSPRTLLAVIAFIVAACAGILFFGRHE